MNGTINLLLPRHAVCALRSMESIGAVCKSFVIRKRELQEDVKDYIPMSKLQMFGAPLRCESFRVEWKINTAIPEEKVVAYVGTLTAIIAEDS